MFMKYLTTLFIDVPKMCTHSQVAKPTRFEYNNFTIKCCQRKNRTVEKERDRAARRENERTKKEQNIEQHQARKMTDREKKNARVQPIPNSKA